MPVMAVKKRLCDTIGNQAKDALGGRHGTVPVELRPARTL